MNQNPFMPPKTQAVQMPPVVGVLGGNVRDLRSIAVYQKGILVCIAVYILAVIASIALQPNEPTATIVGIISVAAIVGGVFVFMLSIKVYGVWQGILFAVLTLGPCIGLLMLLVINGKATAILKRNGYKVGLLGAKLSAFPKQQ